MTPLTGAATKNKGMALFHGGLAAGTP